MKKLSQADIFDKEGFDVEEYPFNPKQIAEQRKKSVSQIRRLCQAGSIKAIDNFGTWAIHKSEGKSKDKVKV